MFVMKKYLVLGILFLLPITVYVFFATGKNNFVNLPVLKENVSEITDFETTETVALEDNITILGFLGNDVTGRVPNVFNLAHKVYEQNYRFHDLQFVMVVQEGNETAVEDLLAELAKIAGTEKWKFIYGNPVQITALFRSLQTEAHERLDENLSSENVYIIDKDRKLRGRDDDREFGYSTSTIADLNNKMRDDIKILLAEYRLALKKNTRREI